MNAGAWSVGQRCVFVELLPLWEEFCRYRDDEAKLADDQPKNTVDAGKQQRRGRRSVKSASRPQERAKRNANVKVICAYKLEFHDSDTDILTRILARM